MTTMWGDCPKADILDAWRDGLQGCDADQIRVALTKVAGAYPEWPPTLGEFVSLCKPVVHASHRQYLPAPREAQIDPALELEVTRRLFAMQRERKRDPKDWAREIMARHECGEHLLLIQIQFAREALL